jgi:hydroxymethylpyrimidine/phosphomethylpyrimidine kinase
MDTFVHSQQPARVGDHNECAQVMQKRIQANNARTTGCALSAFAMGVN